MISNLACTLCVAVEQILMICVRVGCIVFLQLYKKNSNTKWPMKLNYCKCPCFEMGNSNNFKFGTSIAGHCPTYCMDFGEFRIRCFTLKVYKMSSYA